MIAVKAPQWRAAIDFKWIRDNKEAVAANIKNRNFNANLDRVLELYDKLLNLQKVRFRFCIPNSIMFLFGNSLSSVRINWKPTKEPI